MSVQFSLLKLTKIQTMIWVYLALKHLWNKKSSLPMIENLTPLIHKWITEKEKAVQIKKIRPSSAGQQVNVIDMIKQLKKQGGTGEKSS